MQITVKDFETKRDGLDATILAELPQNTILALHKVNLLDALIEQGATFTIPPYINNTDSFLDDLLKKAHLFEYGCEYRVYIKKHDNSVGSFYNGIQVMPHYQFTNLARCAEYVGAFKTKGKRNE